MYKTTVAALVAVFFILSSPVAAGELKLGFRHSDGVVVATKVTTEGEVHPLWCGNSLLTFIAGMAIDGSSMAVYNRQATLMVPPPEGCDTPPLEATAFAEVGDGKLITRRADGAEWHCTLAGSELLMTQVTDFLWYYEEGDPLEVPSTVFTNGTCTQVAPPPQPR